MFEIIQTDSILSGIEVASLSQLKSTFFGSADVKNMSDRSEISGEYLLSRSDRLMTPFCLAEVSELKMRIDARARQHHISLHLSAGCSHEAPFPVRPDSFRDLVAR